MNCSQQSIRTVAAVAGVVIMELYRRKDFYVLLVITALITLLMGSFSFYGESHVARYLKEICLLLVWISSLVIAVGMTARQLPAEIENRTIYPLLAKPISRAELVAGKFLGCWQASGIALLVFYVFLSVVSASQESDWSAVVSVQALWLHWWMLAIVIGITLLGSVVFAAPSSNATITVIVVVGILLLGQHLNQVALKLDEPMSTVVYGIYFAIPHLEFFDLRSVVVHNWGVVSWMAVLGATFYALCYTLLLLGVTWLVFRRKPLK